VSGGCTNTQDGLRKLAVGGSAFEASKGLSASQREGAVLFD
jgi:hypothetical protein